MSNESMQSSDRQLVGPPSGGCCVISVRQFAVVKGYVAA